MGGTEAVVMNYLRAGVPFDFVVHGDAGHHEAEARTLGARIHRVPTRAQGLLANIRAMRQLYKTHRTYDTVILCTEHAFGFIEPAVAWWCRVKYRAAWSHFSDYQGASWLKKWLHYPARPWLRLFTNFRLACTVAAGRWLFGCSHKSLSIWFPSGSDNVVSTNFELVKNAIDVDKFAFDVDKRNAMRKQLTLDKQLTVGIIGRLSAVKHHAFAFQIFARVITHMRDEGVMPDAMPVLLVIGDGDERERLTAQARALDIDTHIRFTGAVDNVHAYYQALDMVIMPSVHEGFPMVAVEAQAAGLPVVLSDTLSREIALTPLVRYIGIKGEDVQAWADAILSLVDDDGFNATADCNDGISSSGIMNRNDPAIAQALTHAGFSMQCAARTLNEILGVDPITKDGFHAG